jgi:hypothetical protein
LYLGRVGRFTGHGSFKRLARLLRCEAAVPTRSDIRRNLATDHEPGPAATRARPVHSGGEPTLFEYGRPALRSVGDIETRFNKTVAKLVKAVEK